MFSVIFEVCPRQGKRDEYLGHAKSLKPLLEQVDGFIDNERFASRTRPGWILSHSTWRDEKSVIRWRTHARHHLIQKKGRFEVFSDYHLRVGEVTADTHPPARTPIREQRFDATEAGRSKLCMLVELTPRTGTELPADENALLHGINVDTRTEGLNTVDVFDSIYHPGQVLVLLSWTRPADVAALRLASLEDAETMRCRAVRVIRDYGMFDRRESPQYFQDVGRRPA